MLANGAASARRFLFTGGLTPRRSPEFAPLSPTGLSPMSDAATPATPAPLDPLEPFERRVLGVLAEKSQTSKSADGYPMTLNSVVLGCNQKSNRDPVYDLTEDDVEETLEALAEKGLTMKQVSGRADRWKHQMYDRWGFTRAEMAVVAELLLRGPQTLGDLRGRASRMTDIADMDALKGYLNGLIARGFVVPLMPLDRRGAAVTHAFHPADEMDQVKAQHGGGTAPDPAPRGGGLATLEARLNEAFEEIAKLKEAVARLERRSGE